jgi:hypothetical protein
MIQDFYYIPLFLNSKNIAHPTKFFLRLNSSMLEKQSSQIISLFLDTTFLHHEFDGLKYIMLSLNEISDTLNIFELIYLNSSD